MSVGEGEITGAARRRIRGSGDGVRASSALERLFYPLHWLVFRDPQRRGCKLLRFAETEADGGRDLVRAAELTQDALLRRLYLRHALDEQRHADLFRRRGRALLAPFSESCASFEANWLTPGERGLDDLRVEKETDENLLAFLHLSERAAAARFAIYEHVLACDEKTQEIFAEILRDEVFHMNYTEVQLRRVSPRKHGARLMAARAGRLWKGYLRIAMLLGGLFAGILLVVQYFVVLPIFALVAKRSARRERVGFSPRQAKLPSFGSQYG